MKLEKIHISSTKRTPDVLLNPEGIINIKGRGLVINRTKVIPQIMDWINEYLKNPAGITYVNIEFEYLNSLSTTMLVSVLRKFTEVKPMMKKLIIRWYYEHDDNDILERGEYVQSAINHPIEFVMSDSVFRKS